jgi:hypothetical protein
MMTGGKDIIGEVKIPGGFATQEADPSGLVGKTAGSDITTDFSAADGTLGKLPPQDVSTSVDFLCRKIIEGAAPFAMYVLPDGSGRRICLYLTIDGSVKAKLE